MYKIIIGIFAINLALLGNTFQWISDVHLGDAQSSSMSISQLIESDINALVYDQEALDISAAIPKDIQKPTLPPKVKEPILPQPIQLTRGEFEKTSAFKKRVQEATKERDQELTALQERYRKDVEARNVKIEKLETLYNQKISARNQILKNLQIIKQEDNEKLNRYHQEQKNLAYAKLDLFAKEALSKVYGAPKLSYINYNPDAEILYLTLHSSNPNKFSKNLEIKATPEEAQSIKNSINSISPEVFFDITLDDNQAIKLSLKSVSLNHKERLYLANDVSSDYNAKPMSITIANKNTNFEAQNKELVLQQAQSLEMQNPNLNDKIKLGAVAYNAKGAIIGSNPLLNEANDLRAAKINPKHWLFMIAIENYAETDNVIFATRSAQAIKKTIQKRFGIDKRHTIALLNEKASSGAIKDNLLRLMAKVKAEDTIYFYYSGHGVPGSDGDAYILPSDKIVDFIDRDPFFKLENIYSELAKTKAKHSFAFIDACFSGKTDNASLFKGVAATLVVTKKTVYDNKKLTIITAGKDNEFSNMYKNKKYRLFSYYLTKGLLNSEDNIQVLYNRVNANVIERSSQIGDRYIQTPQIYGNTNVSLD